MKRAHFIHVNNKITDYLNGFQYLNITSSDGGASKMFSMVSMETKQALEMQARHLQLVLLLILTHSNRSDCLIVEWRIRGSNRHL